MCGPKFRPPTYNKTREDANLLPISKPFVSWRALFKTNQCFLQCKLGCISTFWQPIDKRKDKFIGNYAFCKNATYIKTNFQIKKGPLQNLRARKSTIWAAHPRTHLSTKYPPGSQYFLIIFGCPSIARKCGILPVFFFLLLLFFFLSSSFFFSPNVCILYKGGTSFSGSCLLLYLLHLFVVVSCILCFCYDGK